MKKNKVLKLGFLGILFFAALGVAVIFSVSSKGLQVEESLAATSGEPVKFPQLKIKTLDGELLDTEALNGSPIVINFWGSWCGPCRYEADELEQAWKDYRGKGVRFVGIAVQDTEKGARGFIKEFGITYPNALDRGDVVMNKYNIFGVPMTFFVDAKGYLVYKHFGVLTTSIIERELKRL